MTYRPLKPCGTHAAFNRHKTRREPIDAACWDAERKYQRDKKRKARADAKRGPDQQPLLAAPTPPAPRRQPIPANCKALPIAPITAFHLADELAKLRDGYCLSYTRERGLEIVPALIVDSYFDLAPMADDDLPLAEIVHLPVGRSA